MKCEWVILDTETDGLYYPINVVEIAAQRMCGYEPVGEPFQAFLNHNVPIPPEAQAVHGYTQDFLRQHGKPPLEVYAALREYIEDRPVSSHYLSFDWDRTLVPELYRLGLDPIGQKGLCTWLLSRRVIHELPSHKLDRLRDHFSLFSKKNHSASGDVQSVVDLVSRVISERLLPIGIEDYDGLLHFSRLCPIQLCRCMVQGLDYNEEVARIKLAKKQSAKEQRDKIKRFQEFYGRIEAAYMDTKDISSLLYEPGIISEDPEVQIRDKVFLFTGKMAWGPRSKADAMLQKHGGILSKAKYIKKDIDYLVLGEDAEAGWMHRFGGKISDAIEIKMLEPDSKLTIIMETDFISAVNKLMEDESTIKTTSNNMS